MKNIHRIGAVAFALAMAPAAWSMGPMGHRSMSEARQQYQQDREYCTSGQATEARALCLKEAAAAYAEARQGDSTRAMGAGPARHKKAMHKTKIKSQPKAKPEDK
jgi:hypothetical protein